MIITDIEQIDRLTEEILTASSAYVAVDMMDYAVIKERSASLRAIKLEVQELTEEAATALGRDFSEADNGHVHSALLYVSGKGGDAGIKNITASQILMLLNAIQSHDNGRVNIIWGLGNNKANKDCITILAVIGYSE